jgi:hypothetical protein
MNLNTDIKQFLAKFRDSIENEVFIKLTLSKSTGTEPDLKNVYIRLIEIRSQPMLSFTLRYTTKDITKNYSLEEANGIVSLWLGDTFLNADLFTTEADYTLAFNKKRKAKLLKKKATHKNAPEKSHNREKKQWINPQKSVFLKVFFEKQAPTESDKKKRDSEAPIAQSGRETRKK